MSKKQIAATALLVALAFTTAAILTLGQPLNWSQALNDSAQ